MNMILGSDFIDNNNSFNTVMKREGANVFVQTYAPNSATANRAQLVYYNGSGYSATTPATGHMAYVGVAADQAAISSGCVGWIQIRGFVPSAQAYGGAAGTSTGFTGSVGHAVLLYATATAIGFGATSSGHVGNGVIGQCGVLTTAASGSQDGQIYLTGVLTTVLDGG
jgi:hypothetical protein